MKKLLLIILILNGFSLSCQVQNRKFFPFNVGNRDFDKYGDSSVQQYYLQFDSSIQRKQYTRYSNFLGSSFLNALSYTDNNELQFKPINYLQFGEKFYWNNYAIYSNTIDSISIFNENTKITMKKKDSVNCKIDGRCKSILVPCDSFNFYVFAYNSEYLNKNVACTNSGYYKYSINTGKNVYTSLGKDYLDVFYQPHASDLSKLWVICRDSFQYDVYLEANDSLVLTSSKQHTEFGETTIADFNSTSGWVSVSIKTDIEYKYILTTLVVLEKNLKTLDSSLKYSFYRFDAENGLISLLQENYKNIPSFKSIFSSVYNDIVYTATFPVDCEFSPNDSLLYVLNSYSMRNNQMYCSSLNKGTPTEILQVEWQKKFNTNKILVNDGQAPVYNGIELAENGKIYISKCINYSDTINCKQKPGTYSSIDVIHEPNTFGAGCRYSTLALTNLKHPSFPIDCYNLPENFGRFTNLKFQKSINCSMKADFRLEDSTNWVACDWFVEGDSLRGYSNFEHQFTNPGVYKVYVKGMHRSGFVQWYSDTINVRRKPLARYNTFSDSGCQYVSYTFNDSSAVYQIKPGRMIQRFWKFGDSGISNWSTSNIYLRRDMNYIYRKDGFYTVTFEVNDGYCSDTFQKTNAVHILPAPRPGIDINPNGGCTPLKVSITAKYTGAVDSTHWTSNSGDTQRVSGQNGVSFNFLQAGKFNVYQKQFGKTGCVTSDTMEVLVSKGLESNASPELIRASVLGNGSVILNWKKVSHAASYLIYKNNVFVVNLNDTFYIDESVQTQSNIYQYVLYAVDSCGEKSISSNLANNILLKAQSEGMNTAILQWNAYRFWSEGVDSYAILQLSTQKNLLNQTGDTFFTDSNFLIHAKVEKCYQVIAYEKKGNHTISESNILCVPYPSAIWIPSAVSINGNGLNETLKITSFGIQSFLIEVYNRWGQKVYSSTDLLEEWRPNENQQGVYIYLVKANSEYGEYIGRGTITVLR